MTNQEIFSLINDLIKTCNKGERRFRHRAEIVRSPKLAVILACLGDNCQHGARELQNHLLQLGGHPAVGRSRWDVMHRARLLVRRLFCSNLDLALLSDCKDDEERAVARYQQALDYPLPEASRTLIKRQSLGARCNRVRISDLLILEQVMCPKRDHPPEDTGQPLRTDLKRDTLVY